MRGLRAKNVLGPGPAPRIFVGTSLGLFSQQALPRLPFAVDVGRQLPSRSLASILSDDKMNCPTRGPGIALHQTVVTVWLSCTSGRSVSVAAHQFCGAGPVHVVLVAVCFCVLFRSNVHHVLLRSFAGLISQSRALLPVLDSGVSFARIVDCAAPATLEAIQDLPNPREL